MKKSEEQTPEDGRTWFYRIFRFFALPLLRLLFRLEGRGVEHLPAGGPFILASNHTSYLDPLMLGGTCPRMIHFIMLKSFWEKPLLGWVCRRLGGFPVDQNGPVLGSLRRALVVLKAGQVLGIFPEGGRSSGGLIREGKGGVAFLAAKTGLPVVPAAIVGAGRALPPGSWRLRFRRIVVVYGEPLRWDQSAPKQGTEDLSRFTAELMDRIASQRETVTTRSS